MHHFKRRQWDFVSGGSRDRKWPSTTFFFTSFPENIAEKDFFCVFYGYIFVDEVVIPARRNKQGRGFGFAHFFEVSDV